MYYDLGDPIPLTIQTYNAGQQPEDASEVTLTVQFPDGTTTTYTSAHLVNPVTKVGTGLYRLVPDLFASQVGAHIYRWSSTGVNATTFGPDIFDVRAGFTAAPLLSLAAGRRHLNKTVTTLDDEDELRETIGAITTPVEDVIGPVNVRSVTEQYPAGAYPCVVLRTWPALTLTSLVPVHTGGESYLPADLDLDLELAVVRRKDSGVLLGPLRIVYQVGRRVVDPAIREASKVILRHLWDLQRGRSGARRGLGEDPDDVVPTPSGFLIPRRAAHLLHPFRRPPNSP